MIRDALQFARICIMFARICIMIRDDLQLPDVQLNAPAYVCAASSQDFVPQVQYVRWRNVAKHIMDFTF